MLSKEEYYKQYQIKYQKIKFKDYLKKTSNILAFNNNKLIYSFLFLSIPLFFTFFIDYVAESESNNHQVIISKNYNLEIEKIDNMIEEKSLIKEKSFLVSLTKKSFLNKFNDKSDKINSYYSNQNNKSKEIIDNFEINNLDFSKNISKKKQEFIKIVLPLSIDQNQKILAQRQRLIEIKKYLNFNKTLSNKDQKFLKNLALNYDIINNNRHKIDIINDLLITVDIIPNSIVLAQAANESGWGTSRFAKEYNALFGEYTYDVNTGVVPLERQPQEKHLVKFFSSINKSVESYFDNINTHYAYSNFRKIRNLQRTNNSFNVDLLLEELNLYAEDRNYVDNLKSIIRINNLEKFDKLPSI